ncbi:MAG: alpha/beta hydrolase, partial [Planctomycetaceae bacterium]|nr:alpha/beta hydrolase [Planctomycetaceae bacterium]
MTAILSNPELTEVANAGPDGPEAAAERILRTPFYLQSRERPLLGWLHRPKELESLDQGIVICSPVGYEHLHAYRGLRHLADRLAEQGFPVLRFDWDGMGDSVGTDHDPDRLATWKQNLRDALRWMKEEVGCRRMSIIGLRIGGSIASLIAEEQEIDEDRKS